MCSGISQIPWKKYLQSTRGTEEGYLTACVRSGAWKELPTGNDASN